MLLLFIILLIPNVKSEGERMSFVFRKFFSNTNNNTSRLLVFRFLDFVSNVYTVFVIISFCFDIDCVCVCMYCCCCCCRCFQRNCFVTKVWKFLMEENERYTTLYRCTHWILFAEKTNTFSKYCVCLFIVWKRECYARVREREKKEWKYLLLIPWEFAYVLK